MPARISAREPDRAASATRLLANARHSPLAATEPLERIGAGGTAEVWRATTAQGPIALKVLRPESNLSGDCVLQHEHAVLDVLRHPSIVATVGLVQCRLGTALALEHLAGGDLVPLSGGRPRSWIGVAAQIAAALAHIHACGYAYRDLKARNVLFDSAGCMRLIDFASALPLGAPQPAGGITAAYRPQAAPSRVTAYEDEVALAVLLYELLTGCLPFGRDGRSRGAVAAPRFPVVEPRAPLAQLGEIVVAVLSGRTGAGSLPQIAAVIDTVAAGCR
jgi:serine/threonine protein kinase